MDRQRRLWHERLELRELLSVREADVVGDFGSVADASAYVVPLDEDIEGTLSRSDFQDIVSLEADEGRYYGVEFDFRYLTAVRVLDIDGVTELARYSSVDRYFAWRAPENGRYYLDFQSTAAPASYQFSVSELPHNFDAAKAVPLPDVETNGRQTVHIQAPSDFAAWYQLSTETTANYVFDVSPHAEYWIYENDGVTPIAQIPNENLGARGNFLFSPQSAGTKYVRVANHQSSAVLRIRKIPIETITVGPKAGDANLTFGAPTQSTAATVSSSLAESDDTKSFSLRAVPGPHFYRLDVQLGTLAAARLQLFDSQQRLLSRFDITKAEANPTLTWQSATEDILSLQVTALNSAGTFEVGASVVTDDGGDQPESAVPLDFGQPVLGTHESDSDIDWYSFQTGQQEGFRIDAPAASDVVLVQPGGQQSTLTSVQRSAYVAQQAGEYRIGLRSNDVELQRTTTYEFEVERLVDDQSATVDGSAPAILVEQEVEGIIDYAGDVDRFAFEAIGGTHYLLNASTSARYRIYEPQGNELITNYGRSFYWYAEEAGRYWVEVAEGNSPLADYGFLMQSIPDDHPDTFVADGIRTLNFGETVQGTIERPDDRDIFAIQAGTGIDVHLQFNGRTMTATFLDSNGLDLTNGETNFRTTAAGTYFVAISRFGIASSLGDYEFKITAPPDDHPDEFGDNLVLQSHDPVTVNLASSEDIDRFFVDLVEGQPAEFALVGPSGQVIRTVSLQVIDLDTDAQLFSTQLFPREWLPPRSGRFGVSLTATGPTQGELEARVADDHPDEPNAAVIALRQQSEVVGRFDRRRDRDTFRLELQASDDLIVSVNRSAETEVLSEQGEVLHAGSKILAWEAPRSGIYFLRVGASLNTGEYRMQVDFSDDYPDVPDLELTPLGAGTYAARLEAITDVDVFPIEVDQEIAWEFTLEGFGNEAPRVTLVAPDGITEITTIRGDDTAQFTWKFSEAGTHFVRVEASPRQLDYSLSMTPFPLSDDVSGFPAADAPSISNGVRGRIEVWNDNDLWAFDALDDEIFFFDVASVTLTAGADLRVLDASGTPQSDWIAGNSFPSITSLQWRSAIAGRYYLAVRQQRGVGTYEITLDSSVDDYPDAIGEEVPTIVPGTLDSPTIVSGQVQRQMDADLIRFEAEAGQFINVVPVDGEFTPVLITFVEDRLTPISHSTSLWQVPYDGEFYIRFTATQDVVVPFRFEVSAVADDHGNYWPLATSIPANPGETARIAGSIDGTGDVDFFRFPARGAIGYLATLIGDADSVTAIDSAGNAIPIDRPWKVSEDQIVYFSVGGNSRTEYELVIEEVADDFPDRVSADVPFLPLTEPAAR